MSLTNPNALVTEERLAEFYQTILPYLGGMPDILANKFSKGDLYSTDEKMIGRWIDGKPIYQKTIDCGTLPNNTTKTVAHGITDLGYVINIKGNAYRSSDNFRIRFPDAPGVDAWINSTNINIKTNADKTGYTVSNVTIQYTKTTDSAVYIGDDTDYSTEEKIIGTWIDGKPIYQKVYSGLSKSVSASSWTTLVNDINDISSLIQAVGYAYSGTLIMGFKEIEYNSNTNAVNAIAITSRTLNTLVLRYTKSS